MACPADAQMCSVEAPAQLERALPEGESVAEESSGRGCKRRRPNRHQEGAEADGPPAAKRLRSWVFAPMGRLGSALVAPVRGLVSRAGRLAGRKNRDGEAGRNGRTSLSGEGARKGRASLSGEGARKGRTSLSGDGGRKGRTSLSGDGGRKGRTSLSGADSRSRRTSLSGEGSCKGRTSVSGEGNRNPRTSLSGEGGCKRRASQVGEERQPLPAVEETPRASEDGTPRASEDGTPRASEDGTPRASVATAAQVTPSREAMPPAGEGEKVGVAVFQDEKSAELQEAEGVQEVEPEPVLSEEKTVEASPCKDVKPSDCQNTQGLQDVSRVSVGKEAIKRHHEEFKEDRPNLRFFSCDEKKQFKWRFTDDGAIVNGIKPYAPSEFAVMVGWRLLRVGKISMAGLVREEIKQTWAQNRDANITLGKEPFDAESVAELSDDETTEDQDLPRPGNDPELLPTEGSEVVL